MQLQRSFILFVSVVAAVVASCSPLWADGALDTPVTLAVKGWALSDIAESLSKQVGCPVRATRDVADDKATIFVDGKPLREVLAGMELVSGGRWRWSSVEKDGAVSYELWEPAVSRPLRQAAEASASGGLPLGTDDALDRIIELSKGDRADNEARLAELSAKADRNAEEEDELLLLRASSGMGLAAVELYRGLSSDVKDLLQLGCHVCLQTDAAEEEWRIPAEVRRIIGRDVASSARQSEDEWAGRGWDVTLSAGARGNSKVSIYAIFKCYEQQKDGSYRSISGMSTGSGLYRRVQLSAGDCAAAAKAPLPVSSGNGDLARTVSFTAKDLADEANLVDQTAAIPSPDAGRSDILALLHRKLGVQVIADAFTGWAARKPGESRSVADVLSHLSDGMAPAATSEWGWDGAYVYVRERYPYRASAMEIPNRVLMGMKADLRACGGPTLDSAADYAFWLARSAHMGWTQGARLIMERGVDYRTTVLGVQCESNGYALNFYALLTATQRASIMGSGLRVSDLSLPQRIALLSCDREAVEAREAERVAERQVGVYDSGGLRIDKVDSGATGGWPSLVRIEKRGSDRCILGVGPSRAGENGKLIASFTAPDPETAVSKCASAYPQVMNGPHFLGVDAGYVMVLTFSDGSAREVPIPLYERASVGE